MNSTELWHFGWGLWTNNTKARTTSGSLVQQFIELFSWSFASSLGVYGMDFKCIFFPLSPITAVVSVLIVGLGRVFSFFSDSCSVFSGLFQTSLSQSSDKTMNVLVQNFEDSEHAVITSIFSFNFFVLAFNGLFSNMIPFFLISVLAFSFYKFLALL